MSERIRKCPECGSKKVVVDSKHAELYCLDCGVVLVEDIVDLGPEWRSYDEEQAAKRIRTGPPMSYRIHDKGLGTPMPGLPARTKRLRGISIDSSDKTLALALVEIDRMACALKLPNNIKEETSVLSVLPKRGSSEDHLLILVLNLLIRNERSNMSATWVGVCRALTQDCIPDTLQK